MRNGIISPILQIFFGLAISVQSNRVIHPAIKINSRIDERQRSRLAHWKEIILKSHFQNLGRFAHKRFLFTFRDPFNF